MGMAEALTLRDLLPGRLDDVGTLARNELCKNEEVGAMKLAWDYVGSQLGDAIAQALDCDLMKVLAEGWAKADELASFAGPANRDTRSVIELAGHEVSRQFKPVIAVTIGSCPCVELEFDFALSAHFGGVQLTLADGHITSGRTGNAWASAQLSYAGIPLHDAAETRKVAIPGDFELEPPGVPLLGFGSKLPLTGAASES
jgi:hypothetical protein